MKRRSRVAALAVALGAIAHLHSPRTSLSAQTDSWLIPFPGLNVYGIAADGQNGAYAAGVWSQTEAFVRRVNFAGAEMWTDHFQPSRDGAVAATATIFDAAATGDGVVV